ncbi:hypothetical protein Tco_0010148 [Tanacetum coccineum]
MASTRASISKASKKPKINIIPPKELFVDLTHDDTKTSSPTLQLSSPSAPNALICVRILQKSQENGQSGTNTDMGTELSVQKPGEYYHGQ